MSFNYRVKIFLYISHPRGGDSYAVTGTFTLVPLPSLTDVFRHRERELLSLIRRRYKKRR